MPGVILKGAEESVGLPPQVAPILLMLSSFPHWWLFILSIQSSWNQALTGATACPVPACKNESTGVDGITFTPVSSHTKSSPNIVGWAESEVIDLNVNSTTYGLSKSEEDMN